MKKHVSRQDMIKLEAGSVVLLNRAQLDELTQYAPEWVDVLAAHPHIFEDSYEVQIFDRRTSGEKPLSLPERIRNAVQNEEEEF